MVLTSIDRVSNISPKDFKEKYLKPMKPLIITDMSHQWPAYNKWTWDYLKELVGGVKVGVYNNIRAGAKVPVNGADDYMLFGEYIDLIRKGPVELRIFLFNIFKYAPQIVKDFTYPDEYLKGFMKRFPTMFIGGAGSIAHMHYDLDLSHIFHTQFLGKKRLLLIDQSQSELIYRMPTTVESAANFVNWHERLDTDNFPGLKYVKAYEGILGHGETLFMPSMYWHHMQYMESGFAMSLRALPYSILDKFNTIYHLVPMRNFNNLLIKLAPEWWYHKKRELAKRNAEKAMQKLGVKQ